MIIDTAEINLRMPRDQQGQIVQASYSWHPEAGLVCRIIDRADKTTTWSYLPYGLVDESWDPDLHSTTALPDAGWVELTERSDGMLVVAAEPTIRITVAQLRRAQLAANEPVFTLGEYNRLLDDGVDIQEEQRRRRRAAVERIAPLGAILDAMEAHDWPGYGDVMSLLDPSTARHG